MQCRRLSTREHQVTFVFAATYFASLFSLVSLGRYDSVSWYELVIALHFMTIISAKIALF